MAVLESAVRYQDVLQRFIRVRLERHIVISDVNETAADEDVAAAGWVNAVGVWRVFRRDDFHVFDGHLMTAVGHEMKLRRVLQRHSLNVDSIAANQPNQFGSRMSCGLTWLRRLALLGCTRCPVSA